MIQTMNDFYACQLSIIYYCIIKIKKRRKKKSKK
jgi:hypothetical protein